MKLPYSWLTEYVKTKFSADQIADRLTMAGLEVEEVIREVVFEGVVIGEVLEKEKHPNADKLNVAKVNIGKDKIQIVCGASNLSVGQKVPVALVGAKLGDFEIGKATLRGIESNGMICSEKELGISNNHEGIMVLEKDAPQGVDFGEYLGHEEVIDVNILANRPDCMSIIGLAREVSAITNEKLVIPEIKLKEVLPTENVNVEVEDPILCPRYTSRVVKNVSYSETPKWMKERLVASGVRSIDLLVDISNYVMLEYGQPLHFFDLDKLTDKKVIVRSAKKGEQITTLDGVKRSLTEDNLVIANSSGPIALAGVMGGATTEIDQNTKNIFIEAAVFDKASIRKTSRSLGLRSEAVARFEKGIGLASPVHAANRAAQLLSELAGGEVCKGLGDTYVGRLRDQIITFEPSKLNRFMGTDYPEKQISDVLVSLGFAISHDRSGYKVTVPEWRVDINEAVDLYEEVSRVIGFESVPSTLPFDLPVIPEKNKLFDFTYRVRNILSGIGLSEIMTYSFISEKALASIGEKPKDAYEVANPMVKEQKYLRTSLVPAMIESLVSNQYRADSVRFYEIAKTFQRTAKGLPHETTALSVGVIGGINWPQKTSEGADFYDLKGILENLFLNLGISMLSFEKFDYTFLDDGRSAKVLVDGTELGFVGEIKNTVANDFGLKKVGAVAQIDLDKLLQLLPSEKIYQEIGRFQHSIRDISFQKDESRTAAEYLQSVTGSDILVREAKFVDVYQSKEKGTNLTIRIWIESLEGTLTDSEVEKVVTLCQNKIVKLGGVIRGVKN